MEITGKRKKLEQVQNAEVTIDVKKVKKHEDHYDIDFEYRVNYEPKVGEIMVKGTILFDSEEDLEAKWKEDKKLPKEILESVLNTGMLQGTVHATILSPGLRFAPPVMTPKVRIQ